MSSAVISALLANEKRNFLVKAVDEKVKLVLVDLTVCLFGFRHTFSKQTLTKRLCEVLSLKS